MKKADTQKIIAGAAGGAVIGSAATYVATHRKETGEVLKTIARKTSGAVKKIDEVRKDEAFQNLSETATKALRKTSKTNGDALKRMAGGIAGGRASSKRSKKTINTKSSTKTTKKGRTKK